MFIIWNGVWEQSKEEAEGEAGVTPGRDFVDKWRREIAVICVSSSPKSLSPSWEWDGNLQTGDICKLMDQNSLKKPSVCINLEDSLENYIWFL